MTNFFKNGSFSTEVQLFFAQYYDLPANFKNNHRCQSHIQTALLVIHKIDDKMKTVNYTQVTESSLMILRVMDSFIVVKINS